MSQNLAWLINLHKELVVNVTLLRSDCAITKAIHSLLRGRYVLNPGFWPASQLFQIEVSLSMEFNEKAKAREGDYLKIDGQIWVQAWSRRVRWKKSTIPYRQQPSDSKIIREYVASGQNGYASSGMYIFFWSWKEYSVAFAIFFNSFKQILNALIKSQVEMN